MRVPTHPQTDHGPVPVRTATALLSAHARVAAPERGSDRRLLASCLLAAACSSFAVSAQTELPEPLRKAAEAFHQAEAEALTQVWQHRTETQRKEIDEARRTLTELRAKPDLSRADLAGPGEDAFATLRQHLLPTSSTMRRHFRAVYRAEGALDAQSGRLQHFVRQHHLSVHDSDWMAIHEALGQIRAFAPDDYPRLWQSVQDTFTTTHADELRNILDLDVLRGLQALPPITTIDPRLVDAARDHSDDMQRLGFFSHTSPIEGKQTPQLRARRFDTDASGENLHHGQTDPLLANQAWCHSPGHFKTMFMPDWHRIGVGHLVSYWTAMFGR